MPWLGRKASSLLVVLLMATLVVATVGVPAAAQGEASLQEGSPAHRTYTIGVIDEGCPAGAPAPCWDIEKLVGRPGESITLIADLRTSNGFHNLEVDAADATPATPQGPAMSHTVNFTIPADFSGEITYICAVHPDTMVGHIMLPAAFAASGGGAGEPIHHLGVHYLAYWVGVIAFAILFVVYGVTFFLFKYNETSATTDHKDRSGGAVGKVSGGNATLLAIVIGGAILAGVIYLAQG